MKKILHKLSLKSRAKNKVQTTKVVISKSLSTNLENLIVYVKARGLAVECLRYFYNLKSDRRSDFLVLQLLRAITSVGANIAEGYGRYYKKSYRQFLSIARGSCFEVEYWLEVALELNKFNNEMLLEYKHRNREIIKMLSIMMKNLERKTQT